MIAITYPEPDFRIRQEDDRKLIFDVIRKSWVILTDEEWVRQQIISYMVRSMNYPSSLIALEKEIVVNSLKKRFDILVYDREHKPWMMIECKSHKVKLNEQVLQQLLRYHISVPVPYLIITNGAYTLGWRKDGEALIFLDAFPEWVK